MGNSTVAFLASLYSKGGFMIALRLSSSSCSFLRIMTIWLLLAFGSCRSSVPNGQVFHIIFYVIGHLKYFVTYGIIFPVLFSLPSVL